jgi:hypothetical protein
VSQALLQMVLQTMKDLLHYKQGLSEMY